MKHALLLLTLASSALLCSMTPSTAVADPLLLPAKASHLAERGLINGLARAGDKRFVAVGQRGHILYSDDGGMQWHQAEVPVSSDLTAVQFVNAQTGYAVGHDGVVLGSRDGGKSWRKLLDGRVVNALVLRELEAAGGSAELLAEAHRNVDAGPDKPLLDLFFTSADEGFVVGAYNLILHTDDGGKTWHSWFDRVDNPRLLNLYSIRKQGDAFYIAGEGGLLLRLAPGGQRFEALESPYKGSFFGLLPTPQGILAYGMRGNAFLSVDQGKSWQALETGLSASITAADIGPGNRVLLIDQSGRLSMSRDGGQRFTPLRPRATQPPAAAVLLGGERLIVVAGPRGLRTSEL